MFNEIRFNRDGPLKLSKVEVLLYIRNRIIDYQSVGLGMFSAPIN